MFPTAQKNAAPLLKVSPWVEAAFAAEISVLYGNDTTEHDFSRCCAGAFVLTIREELGGVKLDSG